MNPHELTTNREAVSHFTDNLKSWENDRGLSEPRDQLLTGAWSTFNDSITKQLSAKSRKELQDPKCQDRIVQNAAEKAQDKMVEEALSIMWLSEEHQDEQPHFRRYLRQNLKPLRVSGEFIDQSLSTQQVRIAQLAGGIIGLIPGLILAILFPSVTLAVALPWVFAGVALMTDLVYSDNKPRIVRILLTLITAVPTPRSRGITAKQYFMPAAEAWWDYAVLLAAGFETSLIWQKNIEKLHEDQADMDSFYEAVAELKRAQTTEAYQNGVKRLCEAFNIPVHDTYPPEIDILSGGLRPMFIWQRKLAEYYTPSGTVEEGQIVEILEDIVYGSNKTIQEKGRVRRKKHD